MNCFQCIFLCELSLRVLKLRSTDVGDLWDLEQDL
jgi:hypothetical protein